MNQNAVCAPAAGSRNTQKKRFTLKMRTREALTGYLFISVNLIGTLIFVVLPLFMTVVLSFSEWDYTKGLAGMEFVTAYDAFTKDAPRKESERIYVIAREHGKKQNN